MHNPRIYSLALLASLSGSASALPVFSSALDLLHPRVPAPRATYSVVPVYGNNPPPSASQPADCSDCDPAAAQPTTITVEKTVTEAPQPAATTVIDTVVSDTASARTTAVVSISIVPIQAPATKTVVVYATTTLSSSTSTSTTSSTTPSSNPTSTSALSELAATSSSVATGTTTSSPSEPSPYFSAPTEAPTTTLIASIPLSTGLGPTSTTQYDDGMWRTSSKTYDDGLWHTTYPAWNGTMAGRFRRRT